VLDAVAPELRFVPKEQYAQYVHNVDYHRALAKHKLWQISQDQAVLADAVKTWRAYLDGNARSLPAEESTKPYVENAQVYWKQASSSLSAGRGVSRQ
jgi:hypothetical protein